MKCCEQYASALSAFVDGELSEKEKEEVLAHVERCQNCREYLSELMIVHAAFEEMPELDAPAGFSERVLERMHEEARVRSRHRRAWPRVLAACFALLVVTAAAWKLVPAAAESSGSAAADSIADNESASAPAAPSDTANDSYSCTYAGVQYDGVQYDGAQYDGSEYDGSGGSEDRKEFAGLTAGDYATVTVSESAAAEFLRERGMAVYVESEQSVSFLVVPEAAHELSTALALNEEETAALTAADDFVIVEVAKAPAEESEEPVENTPADEEVEP